MKTNNIFLVATIASFVGGAAMAQTTTFANQGAADDAVTDLEDAIADDARDIGRIGNEGREVGTYGSMALRATSTSNDGDTSNDVGVGLRYGTFDGVNGIDVTASFAYSEDNGTQTDNTLLLGFDYRRDFGPTFFAYAKADASFDKLSTTVGDYYQDVFVGAGLGYRIFNDANTQWSIQAGPGYRVAEVVGAPNVNEAAASVSSNFFRTLSDNTYVTNDTDVIYSEFATTVNNELALNVSMSNNLVLRTSYTTNFNNQSDSSFTDAENTFGVSVVYNFN
jgi:putative salt-induced outer membrane protein